MPSKTKLEIVSELLFNKYGKTEFNYNETAEILGCSRAIVGRRLLKSGVLVSTNGKEKKVDLVDLADMIVSSAGRVSPVN